MAGRFEGTVAAVTGGANGIGRAVVQAFLGAGADVLCVDLVDPPPDMAGPHLATLRGDVADAALSDRAVAEAVARFGRLDVLVNDAAAYPDATVVDMEPDAWRRVFDVNVTGPFMLCRAFARHRIDTGGGGRIVSISTGSTRSPRPAGAAYAASKAALETLSRVLAMELGPHRITANVVSPGYIDVREWSDRHPDRATPELREALVRSIPLGRAGDPRDIAEAVLFLCSDAATHISGAVIDVDGGSLAGRYTLAEARP
jgi:NAD(P)-dependent dehydrogenase (short-subunit alcohol dehydrogenase family)